MTELTPDPTSTPAPGADNPQTAPPAEGDTAPTQQSPGGGTGSTGSPEPAPAGGYGADGAPAPGAQAGAQAGAQVSGGQDDPGVISDDQLPEDLRPTDDNPLAKPPTQDDDPGLSLEGGGAQL